MSWLNTYLSDILNVNVIEKPIPALDAGELPLMLSSMYRLIMLEINEREIIVLERNRKEYFTTAQYREQFRQIEQFYKKPVVLLLDPIDNYHAKRLSDDQIAFIIPGHQIFIPELKIDLKETGFSR